MESERHKFEAVLLAGNSLADVTRFEDGACEYVNMYVQSTWEGWQMRAMTSLGAEQAEAIVVSIDTLRAYAARCRTNGMAEAANDYDNHIATLRTLITPTNPADTERKE